MSVENSIFLRHADLPHPEAWQRAIKAAGFPLRIDTGFVFGEFEGYLPCVLEGDECGFELFTELVNLNELSAEGQLSPEQRETLDDRTYLVTLATHSSFRDGLASVLAGAALCATADGILSCAGDPFVSSSGALEWARSVEPGMRQGLLKQLEREKRRQHARK